MGVLRRAVGWTESPLQGRLSCSGDPLFSIFILSSISTMSLWNLQSSTLHEMQLAEPPVILMKPAFVQTLHPSMCGTDVLNNQQCTTRRFGTFKVPESSAITSRGQSSWPNLSAQS